MFLNTVQVFWQVSGLWCTRVGIFISGACGLLVLLYLVYQLVINHGKKLAYFITSISRSIGQAVATNPDVKRLVKRHPDFFSFLHRRIKPRQFTGLPLTILIVIFVYGLTIFFGLAEDLVRQQPTLGADIRIANLLVFFRNPTLVTFFLWVTVLGTWQVVTVFLLAVIILIWRQGQRQYAIPVLVTVIGSQLFTALTKVAFHRPRPTGLIPAYLEQSFSFPSGHATVAMAFYGFITYYIWRHLKKWRWKVNILFLGFLIIFGIGFSRLYLGVHFLSDVISGYIVGALWLIAGISTIELRRQRALVTVTQRKVSPSWYIVLVAAMAFYVVFAAWYVSEVDRISTTGTTPLLKTASAENIPAAFDTYQLPRFTETLFGNPEEPASLIIMANNDQELIAAFTEAGWQQADVLDIHSLYAMTKAITLKKPYPRAPITPSFWYNNVHDFGFEKPTSHNIVTERHHARVWKTPLQTTDGKRIYIATASFDTSFKWLVTHHIEPAIDTERDLLLHDLQATDHSHEQQETQFVPPTLGKNFAGDAFFTDGRAYILEIQAAKSGQ